MLSPLPLKIDVHILRTWKHTSAYSPLFLLSDISSKNVLCEDNI